MKWLAVLVLAACGAKGKAILPFGSAGTSEGPNLAAALELASEVGDRIRGKTLFDAFAASSGRRSA